MILSDSIDISLIESIQLLNDHPIPNNPAMSYPNQKLPLLQKYNIKIQNNMQITSTGAPSNPVLVKIQSLQTTIPKTRYVIYYKIPIFDNQFKPLQQLKQLLIITNTVHLKILDLQSSQNNIIYYQSKIQQDKNNSITIRFKSKEGSININGIIINKSVNQDIIYSLYIKDICGYANFIKFREKYRTLQNITQKQYFKLNHRLKIIDNSTIFYFNLQSNDYSHYYFTNKNITIQIEQIYSIQNTNTTTQTIFQQQLNLNQQQGHVKATINILQKLQIELTVQAIKNKNYTTSQLACLRILQISPICDQIKIGTDKVRYLAQVKPLLQNRFYDYEFGFLNQNMNSLNTSNSNIYQHIDKLTKSFPNYPHLKNSKLIEINGSKLLTFSYDINKKTSIIKVPLVYILQGINIIQNETHTLSFYIQFTGQTATSLKQKRTDIHRLYQLKIADIWNLGSLCKYEQNFNIKIITSSINYIIPFISQKIQTKQFKKQVKYLNTQQQYSQFHHHDYFVIGQTGSKNKLILCKTQHIADFYLLDLKNSSSISFQIISKDQILLQGTILRQQILSAQDHLRVILSSPDNLTKVILIFEVLQIHQKNQSLRTYYQFMYKLQFTDNIPCDTLQYNLQIKRLTDNKKLSTKVFPQISDDDISSLHYLQSGFFQSTLDDIQINLLLRNMYYNQQIQKFDNCQLINKKIVVNSSPKQLLQKNCTFISVKQEGYSSIQFDLYDEKIQKKLKFYLEVYMRKLPLLDLDHGRYIIKIPQYLWKMNYFPQPYKQISMQIHLSSRKKKHQKISIYPDNPIQYYLPQHNYKDGISLTINDQIGYDKIIDVIKIKCDISKNGIIWQNQGQWHLSIININDYPFYFLLKSQFDPNANNKQNQSDGSQQSIKTAGKQQSQRSYSQKIDPLAKTVQNFQLLKLKKAKNDLILQNRHLTTKFVQRQQTIVNLKKKLDAIQQQLKFKKQPFQQLYHNLKQNSSNNNNTKMKQFYRSICQCGAKNPQYNGFCQDCLKDLKKKYQVFFREYNQKSIQYQKICFDKFNSKQKYQRAKNKLKLYKQKLRAGQSIEQDPLNQISKQFQQKQLKRKIQQNKLQLFKLQQQRTKLQLNAKNRLTTIQNMIKKQDNQIWTLSIQMETIKQSLNLLDQQIQSTSKS